MEDPETVVRQILPRARHVESNPMTLHSLIVRINQSPQYGLYSKDIE